MHLPLPEATIAELADPGSFERGIAYCRQGRVELGTATDDAVRAVVRGTLPYTVEIRIVAGETGWSCSCPMGDRGVFCKHCVAVAFELDPGTAPPAAAAAPEPQPDLHALVAQVDPDRLVAIVAERAQQDWVLRELLTAETGSHTGESANLTGWKTRIEAAFAPYGDFVSYAAAPQWAAGIDEVINALEQLTEAAPSDEVARLIEFAHHRADEATQYVDDSDGYLQYISERLADLHLMACIDGKVDPVALAGRLLDLELKSELDGFRMAALSHADALGDTGLAEYRRLVQPRGQALDPDQDNRGTTYALTTAMAGLAQASGDPDELVRIRKAGKMGPGNFLEIARSMLAAQRIEEAIQWGRRGLDEAGSNTWQTGGLRDFLARLLRERGEEDQAEDLFWDAFRTGPGVESYRRLITETSGSAAGEETKPRALDLLRDQVKGLPPDTPHWRSPATPLIEILLYEGHPDEAWQIATDKGCDERLWLTLARARERTHPHESIPVYRDAALREIEKTKRRGYETAVGHLDRIHRMALEMGEPAQFTDIIDAIRQDHRRKTSLMGLLHDAGW